MQALLGQTPLSPQLGEELADYWAGPMMAPPRNAWSACSALIQHDRSPSGIDRMVGGAEMILTISAMRFTPTGADLDMVAGMRVPSLAAGLTLGAVDVMVPEGLGARHGTYLGEFPAIPFGKSEFQLMPGSAEDGSGTYIDWDCDGFESCKWRASSSSRAMTSSPQGLRTKDRYMRDSATRCAR